MNIALASLLLAPGIYLLIDSRHSYLIAKNETNYVLKTLKNSCRRKTFSDILRLHPVFFICFLCFEEKFSFTTLICEYRKYI